MEWRKKIRKNSLYWDTETSVSQTQWCSRLARQEISPGIFCLASLVNGVLGHRSLPVSQYRKIFKIIVFHSLWLNIGNVGWHTLRRTHFTSPASFITIWAFQVCHLDWEWFGGLMGPPSENALSSQKITRWCCFQFHFCNSREIGLMDKNESRCKILNYWPQQTC